MGKNPHNLCDAMEKCCSVGKHCDSRFDKERVYCTHLCENVVHEASNAEQACHETCCELQIGAHKECCDEKEMCESEARDVSPLLGSKKCHISCCAQQEMHSEVTLRKCCDEEEMCEVVGDDLTTTTKNICDVHRGVFSIVGMTCASCVSMIQHHMNRRSDVVSVSINLMAEKAEIEWDRNVSVRSNYFSLVTV